MNELVTREEVRKIRIIAVIGYILLGLIAIAVAVFSYWALRPSDVLEFKNAPAPVRSIRHYPRAGGVEILDVNYCKKINAKGRVRTSFVSKSREVFLPVAIDDQPAMCLHTEVPILIPKDLPPDVYKVHFHVEYEISPIKTTIEELDSQEFRVE